MPLYILGLASCSVAWHTKREEGALLQRRTRAAITVRDSLPLLLAVALPLPPLNATELFDCMATVRG